TGISPIACSVMTMLPSVVKAAATPFVALSAEMLVPPLAAVTRPALTVCVKFAEVLPLKLPSPLYTAVMVCEPTESEEMLSLVALLPDKLAGAPKLAPSALNCTVPVSVPAPGQTAVTVFVKITGWPNTEGLAEELSDEAVSARFTVCVKTDEAFAMKLESPL